MKSERTVVGHVRNLSTAVTSKTASVLDVSAMANCEKKPKNSCLSPPTDDFKIEQISVHLPDFSEIFVTTLG
ncbi:hypothetical protein OUZ56_026414 [Daphnia magna]|uniref:Uncharacterized protein n=1 Tax=Daphnia magna TaxID=35525 RepID=A0ABQ9ZLP7_9CRUS|nr:hypothetical protein OUZ56_026414 [Daphnia magna]